MNTRYSFGMMMDVANND